jgi:hypothetical protein
MIQQGTRDTTDMLTVTAIGMAFYGLYSAALEPQIARATVGGLLVVLAYLGWDSDRRRA